MSPILHCCSICSKEFKKLSHLKRHSLTHSNEKKFECPTCNKKFTQKSSLETHYFLHNNKNIHECSECHRYFSQRGNLKVHFKSVHLNINKFHCDKCNSYFKSLASFNSHSSRTHAKSKTIQSPNTQDIVSLTNELEDNVELKKEDYKNNTENLVYSEKNDGRFTDNFKFIELMDKNGNKLNVQYEEREEKKYVCNHCNKKFKHPSDIFRHNKTHSLEKNFVCEKCNKSFNLKWNWKQHLKIHDRAQLKQECFKEKNRKYLTHINNELKALQTTNNALTSHSNYEYVYILPGNLVLQDKEDQNNKNESSNKLLSKQKSERATKHCHICSKIFIKPSDLNRHMTKHTKIKNYECEICGRKFSLKGTLKNHILLHLNERMAHMCLVCGKNFSRNSLKVHKRLHNVGPLPFKCFYCNKHFQTTWNRSKHHTVHEKLAKQHGLRPEQVQTKKSKIIHQLLLENSYIGDGQVKNKVNSVFECKWCKQTFSKKYSRERHELIHSGIKLFRCNTCSKSFSQRSTLETHQYTHGKQKNFKCSKCEATYKFRSGLANHTKTCEH